MNLAHWLARQAQINPERPALFLGRNCVADYGTFWSDAQAVAGWLVAQGVRPGDRVALYMKNVPDYLTAFYGIWAAGAAVVPINAKLHGREAAFILADSGASHVFASPEMEQALTRVNANVPVTTVPSAAFENSAVMRPWRTSSRDNRMISHGCFIPQGPQANPRAS